VRSAKTARAKILSISFLPAQNPASEQKKEIWAFRSMEVIVCTGTYCTPHSDPSFSRWGRRERRSTYCRLIKPQATAEQQRATTRQEQDPPLHSPRAYKTRAIGSLDRASWIVSYSRASPSFAQLASDERADDQQRQLHHTSSDCTARTRSRVPAAGYYC
jgi:hypothetical protein